LNSKCTRLLLYSFRIIIQTENVGRKPEEYLLRENFVSLSDMTCSDARRNGDITSGPL